MIYNPLKTTVSLNPLVIQLLLMMDTIEAGAMSRSSKASKRRKSITMSKNDMTLTWFMMVQHDLVNV